MRHFVLHYNILYEKMQILLLLDSVKLFRAEYKKRKTFCYNKFENNKITGVFPMNIRSHFNKILEESFNIFLYKE